MSSSNHQYKDVVLSIQDQIGIIKLNRPKALNSFSATLLVDVVAALRELDGHPTTVFTVITGEGRFFSAGADILAGAMPTLPSSAAAKKVALMAHFAPHTEVLRSVIDHRKVIVLALNGPAVGGGAAWFTGLADIVLASSTSWLQITFSSLGLVPEFGAAINFAQSIGVRRANEMLMLGRKIAAQDMLSWGLITQIFPVESFQDDVQRFLEEQLKINDGKSMMEARRLMNAPLRDGRMIAVINACDALCERFVEGTPLERLALKGQELTGKREKSKI